MMSVVWQKKRAVAYSHPVVEGSRFFKNSRLEGLEAARL
jgi:hypothetical protein